jgi:HK97 gp10 family phage protein
VRISGIRPEVITALSRTPEIKRQVRAVAAAIRNDAKRRAPRDTGALRRSIRVDNVLDERGNVVYRVGWDKRIAHYGGLVELGTEDTPARPHLRPAADAVRGDGIHVE